jgi:hypothetical protein
MHALPSNGTLVTPPRTARSVLFCLMVGLLLAAAIAHALTASWFPAWSDDVMQADAAVNLYLGNGWTSTAWQSQPADSFWAANNPMYTLLLYFWMCFAGLSVTSIRVFGFCVCSVASGIIAITMFSQRIILRAETVAATVLLLTCDDAVAGLYRTGRADSVTLLVCAIVFAALATCATASARLWVVFLSGLPIFAAGLHAVPAIIAVALVSHFMVRRLRLAPIAALTGGATAGLAILASIFALNNALLTFISQTFVSGYSLGGAIVQAIVLWDDKSFNRLVEMLHLVTPWALAESILINNTAATVMIGMLIARMNPSSGSYVRRMCNAGLGYGIFVPIVMSAAGRYPSYYSWMATTPALCCLMVALERKLHAPLTPTAFVFPATALLVICLGLPLRILKDNDIYGPIGWGQTEAMCSAAFSPTDVVYGDPIVYFNLKQRGIRLYLTTYGGGRGYPRLSSQEQDSITALILRSPPADRDVLRVGGVWQLEESYLIKYWSDGPSEFGVLRRAVVKSADQKP